jgi:flagellar biogenesis protein FliO
MNEWFTINQLSEKTGIPYQTIARYLDRHSQHLRIKKEHKSYLIHDDSIKIIEQIREFYSQRMSAVQVDKELTVSGVPIEHIIEDENAIITLRETLQDMQKSMRELHEKHEKQEQFNKTLLNQLEKQQQFMETAMKERDRKITELLNESLETKKLIASAQEDKKKSKWLFWK